jgi:hypothetical protein
MKRDSKLKLARTQIRTLTPRQLERPNGGVQGWGWDGCRNDPRGMSYSSEESYECAWYTAQDYGCYAQ